MPTLLFSLRGVPDDECNEIKELLDTHKINYYETSAGNWGASMPALWLAGTEELEKSQQLLNEYHHQRATRQRELYSQLKKHNKQKRLSDLLINNPIKFVIYILAIAFVLYLSVKMLFEFGL